MSNINADAGRWSQLTICEQLGSVGVEVSEAIKWMRLNDSEQKEQALMRAFELLNLTIADKRWHNHRLRELCLARALLADFFYGKNEFHETAEKLEKYFFEFAVAARKNC